MDNKLIKMFEKYEKRKRLDEFYQYIEENSLKDEFIEQLFYELFRPASNKDYSGLVNCAMAISKEDLENILGPKTSNRVLGLIQENPYPNVQTMYLRQLRSWSKKQDPDGQQGIFVEKILDAFSQEDMTLGIHKIGTSIR